MTAQPDRAVRSFDEDDLDRRPFINRLVNALIDKEAGRATGIVVGIVGEWGSGKSSVLNLLDEAIHDAYKDGVLVLRFDPWLVSGRDALIFSFFQQLLKTISQDSKLTERLDEFVKVFRKYGKAFAPVAEAGLPGSKVLFGLLDKIGSNKETLHSQRQNIFNLLSKIDIPIVVMIDELDRVEDEEVRAVAQLVRAVADFPSISYVLSYDHQRVVEALGGDARGQAYLEKIVQLPIPLPLTIVSEIRRLFETQLSSVVRDIGIDPPLDQQRLRYDQLMKILLPDILKTPRDIKRIVGMFHVLAGMVWDEVDNVDLLAFTALMSKAPQTEKLIRENYKNYIEDGWRDEDYIAYFGEAEEELEDRLSARISKSERSPAADKLMGFLFSRLTDERRKEEATSLSLCRYRPLLTVLRLGLLPGDFPSAEIREFLEKPTQEILDFMQAAIQTDGFGNFWQRLWDVYLSDNFEDDVHRTFWEAMRQFVLKNDSQWPMHFAAMHDVVENISDLFNNKFFTEDENTQKLGRIILNDLFERGDVEIVPRVLRGHIFHYGIYGWAKRGEKSVFLTEDKTKEFAQRMAEREIPRLLSGDLLISLWTSQILYLIRDVEGDLDETCRSYFDSLVQDDEALPAISLFFNGPKYGSDASTLEQFFNLDKLKERIQEKLNLDESGEEPLEASVKLSYKKVIDPFY